MKQQAAAPEETFDCETLISATMVAKLVQAVKFPATIDIIAKDTPAEEAAAVLAGDPSHADPDTPPHEPAPTEGEVDGLIDDVVSPSSQAQAASPPTPDPWRKVTIKSLQVKVMQAPTIHLALPVTAANITLKISAKVQLGLRIWGKWRKLSIAVRDAEMRDQQACLEMSFERGKLRILPQFESLQLQLPLRLLKWKFTYNVDIAQAVNRHLAANDISTELPSVFFGVPIADQGGLRLSIADLNFKPHPRGLVLCSNFSINRDGSPPNANGT